MGVFGKPNIEKMKAEKDVEGLIKALKYKDREVQLSAYGALLWLSNYGSLKDKRRVVELLSGLIKYTETGFFLGDKDSTVRHDAVNLLGELKDKGAINPLRTVVALDGSHTVRIDAAKALMMLGHEPIDSLERLYYHLVKGQPKCSMCGQRIFEFDELDRLTMREFMGISLTNTRMYKCTVCKVCSSMFCFDCQRPVRKLCPRCGKGTLIPGIAASIVEQLLASKPLS